MYSVEIDPVIAGDSGDYVCLVNNRRRPNAVVRLLVQGKTDQYVNLKFDGRDAFKLWFERAFKSHCNRVLIQ